MTASPVGVLVQSTPYKDAQLLRLVVHNLQFQYKPLIIDGLCSDIGIYRPYWAAIRAFPLHPNRFCSINLDKSNKSN